MKNISGFTLIELMVAIGIVGITLTVGIPSLQVFMKGGYLTTANNELVSAIQVARSGAIQTAESACVCPSSNTETVTPTCNGADVWEAGWISFVDVNTNAVTECVYDESDGDVLLKVWNGVNAGNGLTIRTTSANINANHFVRFNSRGEPVSATGTILQGMFVICDDRGLTDGSGGVIGSAVILSASGSLRTTKDEAIIVSCL